MSLEDSYKDYNEEEKDKEEKLRLQLEELEKCCDNSIERVNNVLDEAIEDCHKTNKILKLVPIVAISTCVIMSISVIAMVIFK